MSKYIMNHFMPNPLRLCLVVCCILFFNSTKAQTRDDMIVNQWAAETLKIDGQLNDWGDSLKYYNENTRFSFNIRNNQETLYLAIRSRDKQNLNRILSRGISFSVNTEGKKKPGATVVFPVIDRSSQPLKPTKPQQEVKEVQQEILSKIRKINVNGFREILDGSISMNNTYGISAAAGFDKQDNFMIEIAIPLQLLEITADQSLLACSIEINGIKAAKTSYDPYRDRRSGMYGYPSRDYGYDRRPAVNKQNLATGFWIKTTLAKNLNN